MIYVVMRRFFTLAVFTILGFACAIQVTAGPRDKSRMIQAASQAINQIRPTHNAPRHGKIAVLKETTELSVIGYEEGGFAVISADDLVPEVLGVSQSAFSGERNENFAWWLSAMQEVVRNATAKGIQLAPIAPDGSKFPTSVEPMLTTHWDQETPYNNYCPIWSGGTRCLTGCVATALAQVLNYHKIPEHGIGQHTIHYENQAVTADFENTHYDWDNMLDDYVAGKYNSEQAHAVATLMRDLGVAVEMEYGGPYEGSGAYSDQAAEGLRNYFGLADATFYDRSGFSSKDWMEIVFSEISENGPLYYGGSDMNEGGHAFVLHGYREDGMVYVNWGWSGDDDGYFDISLLNPTGYSFGYYQDMIGGISGPKKDLVEKTLEVEKAGQLAQLLPDSLIGTLGTLTVTGPVDASDLLRIREMAGRDINNDKTKGRLQVLDLSQATIVSGGGAYLMVNGQELTTSENELPQCAFYGCNRLTTLHLPAGIKHYGDGALALCQRLTEITFEPAADADFILDKGVLWNKDTTELIAVLPTTTGSISLPKGTRLIHDYALAGCNKITQLTIPDGIELIGKEAFRNCGNLHELRLMGRYVPALGGADVFMGMRNNLNNVYVRSGMKNSFLAAAQWKDFTRDHIVEFGTSVKVRNTIRYYGDENPDLRYTMSGDKVDGVPELICDATPKSPVGRYPIHILPGTITDETVDYYDGYLIVQEAPLTVKPADCERYLNAANPSFLFTYEGFKNNEDETVFTSLPVATTTATIDSPAGEYPITATGGHAPNYSLSYVEGVLTVLNETGVVEVETDSHQRQTIYNINGTRVDANRLEKGIYIINGKKKVVR